MSDKPARRASMPSLHYEVLGTIARGGMAEIQLAWATGIEGFETLIAIKRILPHLAKNRDFVEMFLDEARIAATLRHPNIVQVQGIGEAEDDYFLTMEFLHGEDVRHIVKATHDRNIVLPLEHTLSIILGVASALHHAHQIVGLGGAAHDIIHRDVSPQNVIVTYDGGVKLLDFGIARAATRITETREGTLKGKVPYMSPEQCLETPLDRRSDVFSLTVMLWELVCGRRLFTGSSEFEILKRVIEIDTPRASEAWPACPPELDRIIAKGLARDREQRYPTAQALQSDLEAFARDHKIPVSSIGLATFMEELFADKLQLFRAARAAGTRGLRQYVEGRRELNVALTASAIAANAPSLTTLDEHPLRLQAYELSDVSRASPKTLAGESPARRRKRGRAAIWVPLGLLASGVLVAVVGTKLRHPPRAPIVIAAPVAAIAVPVPTTAPSQELPIATPPIAAPAPQVRTSARHREHPRPIVKPSGKTSVKSVPAPPSEKPAHAAPVMLDP